MKFHIIWQNETSLIMEDMKIYTSASNWFQGKNLPKQICLKETKLFNINKLECVEP